MRTSRGLAGGLLVWLLSLVGAGSAHAQLFVAAPDGDPPAIDHAELAYALGDGPAVTWLSVRAERGPIAIVAALAQGTPIGNGLDAWFASLEATASLNVLPPRNATSCVEGGKYAHVAWARDRGSAPTQLWLDAEDEVVSALAGWGLELKEPLPSAESYLIWAFPEESGPRTTRTLRVEGTALSLGAGPAFPLLVSALTRGAQSYPGEARPNELEVTFSPGKRATSDYADQVRAWLEQGNSPILEMRGRGPVFDWSIYEGTLSVAPLVQAYAERAQSELEGDVKACAQALTRFRDHAAPDTRECGDASDAALAFTATGPELTTLSRFVVAGQGGFDPNLFFGGGDVASPVWVAASVAGDDCATAPLPPLVREPPASTPVPVEPAPTEEVVVVEHHYDTDTEVEVGCWGQPRSDEGYEHDDSVDCSSDTSSSSDGDEDCSSDTSSSGSDEDCSSDTSSSSESSSAEIDCSGDSSTSSDSDDDSGCDSDTSNDSDDDSGCDSDTSSTSDDDSGYDGDTCTGSAAPRADRPGAQQASLTSGSHREPGKQKRSKRLKLSLWSVGFAAFMLPIRRRKRPGARAG